jgi:serine/threonine protein kinase
MVIKTFDEFPRPTKDDEPVAIGDWTILHVIGAGGMGVVFHGSLADDTKSAIKIINPELLSDQLIKRFANEISAHKLINSPYVAKLLDSNIKNDPAYMAIEFIYGSTLAKIISNKIQISEYNWNFYARQIFLGLEQIHARGLVHRDIKPANIMKLKDKEMIKIIDLGIVKSEDRRSSNRTTLVGTLPYMSPEQLLGKSATQKSDIFSAGVTLVEFFTKKHPFLSTESTRSLDLSIIENSPNLDGLSVKQKELCEKLLRKNPAERITAKEAIAILDESLKSSSRVFSRIKPKKKLVVPKKSLPKNNASIDPVLLGVIDEFNPQTDSIIKGPIIAMKIDLDSAKFSNLGLDNSIRKAYLNEIVDFSQINNYLLSQFNSEIFNINFYSIKFKSEVYFQGLVDSTGNLQVEAVSDDFLPIKFSPEQKNSLAYLGWIPPSATNPNYSMKLSNSDAGRNEAAKIIAETAFLIYQATKETEIFLSPINDKFVSDIRQRVSISIASDGSFILNKDKTKEDQYKKWQLIGYFERDNENDLILETLVARQIENNKVYKRQNKNWKFIGIIENPIKNGIDKLNARNGFVFNKKLINIFDKTEADKELLTFEGTCQFLDYVPNLSAKYTDKEKIWPLTDDMIELGSDTASEFDDYLGLFTLSSSNVNKNVVLGLFAKHPQTQNFYGRSQGKWKLLFESPLTYGHEIFFVTKDFIDFYDKRSKNPEKPIRHSELEEFLHNPVFD